MQAYLIHHHLFIGHCQLRPTQRTEYSPLHFCYQWRHQRSCERLHCHNRAIVLAAEAVAEAEEFIEELLIIY